LVCGTLWSACLPAVACPSNIRIPLTTPTLYLASCPRSSSTWLDLHHEILSVGSTGCSRSYTHNHTHTHTHRSAGPLLTWVPHFSSAYRRPCWLAEAAMTTTARLLQTSRRKSVSGSEPSLRNERGSRKRSRCEFFVLYLCGIMCDVCVPVVWLLLCGHLCTRLCHQLFGGCVASCVADTHPPILPPARPPARPPVRRLTYPTHTNAGARASRRTEETNSKFGHGCSCCLGGRCRQTRHFPSKG
jgi:hypothetical protein